MTFAHAAPARSSSAAMRRRPKRRIELLYRGSLDNCHLCGRFNFLTIREFDGVFVLRTNTDLAPLEVMLCYKQLTMVEQIFRTAKSLFATGPIFHKLDETIRGHVSCSFLALVLK